MAEVGTTLLCIFNDRPMPGARESGKILFVTCWRCAEAPAPQLILGKMRMPAGWPVGRESRVGPARRVLPSDLLGTEATARRMSWIPALHQLSDTWHHDTDPTSWGGVGWAALVGILG